MSLDVGGNEENVDFDSVRLADCSYWTVKSVRLVEATTMADVRKGQN